jgi:hypothetical protein
MSRTKLLLLSVVCCAFGGVSLWGPADYQNPAWAVNIALAVLLFFLTGKDLKERGWELGYLFAGAYLLPLIGLIVYFALSDRPRIAEPAAAAG